MHYIWYSSMIMYSIIIFDLKLFHKFAKVLLIWKYIKYLMTRIWCLEQVMFHEMNVNKKYFWIFGSFEERNERTQLKFKYITSFHTILYWNKVQTFLDGCSKWHDLFFKSTPKIMSLHFICQCQKQVSSLCNVSSSYYSDQLHVHFSAFWLPFHTSIP